MYDDRRDNVMFDTLTLEKSIILMITHIFCTFRDS